MTFRMNHTEENKIGSEDVKDAFNLMEYFNLKKFIAVSYTASLLSIGAFIASIIGAVFIISN